MATFTDPHAFVRAMKARKERVQRHMASDIEDVADNALQVCRRYTSGNIRQAQLTEAGHPFARNHRPKGHNPRVGLSGAFPLLYINIQSGRLYRSWVKRKVRQGKDGIVWIVVNRSKEAKYALRPGGTKNVIDRGFWKAVNDQVRQYSQKHTVAGFKDALK